MKKTLSLILACLMLVSVFAGVAKAEELTTSSTELTVASGTQVETYDYVCTAKTSDHEINANLVDGLLENDRFGNLVPCLAESFEANEDATVWTFHLKPDIPWVTINGEEYATLTAEDFVTGLRHGAEFGSEVSWLLMGVIEGYSEYLESDFSDEAFEKVGVKALDELTLQYTLEKSTPFFDTMTTYTVLYPINKYFLESMGDGCVLGSPDSENCEFGLVNSDSILYNGGYFVTVNDAKSKIQLEKNEDYWDAENVFLETVTYIYDEGEDPYSIIKGFEQGIYPQAGLRTTWEDYDKYLEKYKDYAYFTLPNSVTFGIVFNFDRQTFEETNYAEDEELRANTHEAILNENFRKALRAAVDNKAKLEVNNPELLAAATLRNINNFPGAGTQSDGTMYFDLVMDAYEEFTGERVDLSDGQDPFYNPEEAMAYIAKAEEEGVKFPIHLDILVPETSDTLVKQAQSFKKSIEDSTEGKIIIELVMRQMEVVQDIAYRNTDPAKMDYDISTFTGWGPDYGDPKSFVDIWSPTTGYYMEACGLGTTDKDGNILKEDIKELVGMMEYEKLYREADAITEDMDARYAAFAKADAKLIEKCFFIPTQQQARGQVVSTYVPFSGPYSDYGASNLKFKGLRLQEEIVTVEQREAAMEEWLAGKK